MPLCKCTKATAEPWMDNGVARKYFRLEFDEINADAVAIAMGTVRTRHISMFAADIEKEEMFANIVNQNKVPNRMLMSYPCPVTPHHRVYQQNTRNHKAGDLILDSISGKPRVFTTIYVDCWSMMLNGQEVPENMAAVQARAANQFKYFSTTPDRNGILRYRNIEDTGDLTEFDQAKADSEAAAAIPPTPTATPAQPATTPATGTIVPPTPI